MLVDYMYLIDRTVFLSTINKLIGPILLLRFVFRGKPLNLTIYTTPVTYTSLLLSDSKRYCSVCLQETGEQLYGSGFRTESICILFYSIRILIRVSQFRF